MITANSTGKTVSGYCVLEEGEDRGSTVIIVDAQSGNQAGFAIYEAMYNYLPWYQT